MRLWSLHPRYLDRQGLIACWREALLAQAVLDKTAGGYAHHPQLVRFRAAADPRAALASYLAGLADEAARRGYRFDRTRIVGVPDPDASLPVTRGQLRFEGDHLRAKLAARSPDWSAVPVAGRTPDPHPLFRGVPGRREAWERG